MKKSLICSFLLAGTALGGEAFRILVEAEDFEGGLPYYPYHNEALGKWYAREANCRSYGAPGRGVCAAVHENVNPEARTISYTFKRPLREGNYNLFVRVQGPHWFDRETILELKLGDARAKFAWKKAHRRFRWIGPQTVELRKPASTLSMTPVQFGGYGTRMLYEPRLRTFWVDTIYITSDLSEKAPNPHLEHNLRTGAKITPDVLSGKIKVEYWDYDPHKTPDPPFKPVASTVKLRPFNGRKNLLPNSSFELGLNDGWSAVNNRRNYCYIFSEANHDADVYHGRFSLRIPENANPFSRLYELPARYAGELTLSAYIKARQKCTITLSLIKIDKKKNRSKPFITIKCEVGTQWRRFSGTGTVEAGFVALKLQNPCEVWLDAVQLERGALSSYAPRAEVEGSLATDFLGNILHDNRPPELSLWFHNSTPQPKDVRLRYRIVDVREKPIAEELTESVHLPPNETVKKPLRVPKLRGIFSVLYALEGRDFPEGELVYCIVPPPATGKERHQLGANMDVHPNAYKLMKRLGWSVQLYCKIYETAPDRITSAPDKWNFSKCDEVLSLSSKLMRTIPCMWPKRLPHWMKDASMSLAGGRRDPTRQADRPYPKLDLWREFVRKLVSRYKHTIREWVIEDESEQYYSVRQFAPIVDATLEAVRRIDPRIKIGLSCTPDYTEELLKYVKHPEWLGAFGASSFQLEFWDGLKVRKLQRQWKKPWYCIGVGWYPEPQFYHSHPDYKPVYWSAARTARDLIYLSIIQDAKVIGHYTGRLWNRFGYYNTDFPLVDYDGTPLPYGATYAIVGRLLAEAIPDEVIELPKLKRLAFLFRLGKRYGAVTWSINVPYYDLHWKTGRKLFKGFTLPLSQNDVEILDMYWNPLEGVKWTNGAAIFDLGEEPIFILSKSAGKDKLIKALRQATAQTEPLAGRLSFAVEKGKVYLALALKNQTEKTMHNLKIDAHFPPDRMLSKTGWMLRERDAIVRSAKPGQWKTTKLETILDLKRPTENATFDLRVHGNRVSAEFYDHLWLLNAPPVSANLILDGSLEEWSNPSPAWIYHTFSWARFGRHHIQLLKGGENANYVTLPDLRASVRASYSKTALYFGIEVEDDDIRPAEKGDSALIKLDPSYADPEKAGNIFEVKLWQNTAFLDAPDNTRHKLRSAFRNSDGTYTLEVEVPWRLLGLKPTPYRVLGFDWLVTDLDNDTDGLSKTVFRWAGANQTLAQLILTPD